MTKSVASPTELEPEAAWELMQSDPSVLMVDVRSDMEFLMIGHAKGAVNLPWIDAPDWTINKNFVSEVRKLLLGRLSRNLRGSIPLILICRSGNRSREAAVALAEAGLQDLHLVSSGFEGPLDDEHHRNSVSGWRHAGLPWEQC